MECVVTAGKQWLPHWACSPTVAQLNSETEARYLTSTGSFYGSWCCSDKRHERLPGRFTPDGSSGDSMVQADEPLIL
jgi:hypothetical protein